MNKPRIYIDTSVVGGCCDEEFAENSQALFGMAQRGEIVLLVSYLLLYELRDAPQQVKEWLDSMPSDNAETIEPNQDAFRLRDHYLREQIVGVQSSDDALHVALATVAHADIIVSWNFRHIVHYDKIRKFNAVNLLDGFDAIEIRSPAEVV